MADTTCSEYEEDDTVDAIIDKLDSSRVSPLADACREGHVDIVRLLIEKGAKIQTKCVEYASSRGYLEIIKLLHDAKGDIIKKSYGLYGASAMGQTEVVRFLLEQGAIPEHDCLQRTCNYGHVDVVKLLIAAGAGFNKGIRLARKYGHPEIVQLLIDAGGNLRVNEGKIVDEWSDFEIGDQHHMGFPDSPHVYRKRRRDAKLVAFCMSCKMGHIEQVMQHLDNGADINTEYQGLCPAAWACSSGHIDIVRLLMERGAKPTLYWFIQASGGGNMDIINLLIGAGADRYYIECGLRAASLRGHTDVVQLLLDQPGVAPNNDSFEAACRYGHMSIVKLLLAAGAHYNCSIGSASRCGHTKVVKVLIDAGGNPNAISLTVPSSVPKCVYIQSLPAIQPWEH